jgi:ribosomal protein S18 acetylase RimI-like enzyme
MSRTPDEKHPGARTGQSGFVIRRGLEQDAQAIDRVFRQSFSDTFAHLYDPRDLAAFFSRFTQEAWRAELLDPGFAFLVVEDDLGLAGYIKLGPITLPVTPRGNAVELRQLYLLKPFHGLGIADTLMNWALEHARSQGAQELFLSVFVDNHRAQAFYRRYGFRKAGRYDFMVGNHADEDIIMRLSL